MLALRGLQDWLGQMVALLRMTYLLLEYLYLTQQVPNTTGKHMVMA